MADVNAVLMTAVGGLTVSETVEGRERYPINVRYPRELRDEPSLLDDVLVTTPTGAQVPLCQLASLRIANAPMAIKSDWPSNYGILGNNNTTYNAHLLAIDYSAGVEDPIPEETLKAYCHNADMWDCASAIIVPSTGANLNP